MVQLATALCLANLAILMLVSYRRVLDEFSCARRSPLLPRLVTLRRTGIIRQTWLGNLGLLAAALINRL